MLSRAHRVSIAFLGLFLLAGSVLWLKLIQENRKLLKPVSAQQAADWASRLSAAREVDVNTATVAELERLPGIGPALAARIVEERNQHGPFASVEDIARVSGIGDKVIESIRHRLVAGHGPS